MAFDVTDMDAKLIESLGAYPGTAVVVKALSSGSLAISFPQFRKIYLAIAQSQTANAARVSDITGNTVTVTGNVSDVAMVIVVGSPRA